MIDETIEEIRDMQTHSSSIVAIKAAEALQELIDRDHESTEEFIRALERNSDALRRSNRSHATLFTTQRELLASVKAANPTSVSEAKSITQSVIDETVETVKSAKHAAAANAQSVLQDDITVLTHDYSSTVLEALEMAARNGHHITAYVTEARPRYLGRKTARTLAQIDRIETHLIVDSAVGYYLDECDRVLVGMDCIVDDTLYNRVGTFPIAVTAAELAVPVTVLGASSKLIDGGFIFENSFRSRSEVMREPAEGFSIENPAYDATPTYLVDSVITDEEIKTVA